jgi:4-aminobutyrate aminotransferase
MMYMKYKPGPKSLRVIERDNKVVSPSLTREYELVIDRLKGCYVWDADGKKYLDFSAGVSVANIGHNNPEVIKAIQQQLKKAIHPAFSDFYADLPVRFIENLLTFLPNNLNCAFLSNSGTEAVEAALKLAKWHTNKKWLIAFEGAFHGRTMGSLSMTKSKLVQRERYEPFLPVKHTPYAYCYRCFANKTYPDCGMECLKELENTIKTVKDDLAAVFIEPIQGEGGYVIPPEEFVKGVRKLCDIYDILLCDDEVQSGCYRTGSFLAIENFGVKSDIVSLSKAIGGGLPIGATLSSKEIMDWVPGSHANTMGGNLLACAAGIASLNYMRKKKLGENAKKIGSYMLKRLEEMKERYEIIGDVRGKGLMIGIELVKDRRTKEFAKEERHRIIMNALARGLMLLPAGSSAIRFCPPLIITKEEADKGLEIFEKALKAK